MRCLTSRSQQPQPADGFTDKDARYNRAKTSGLMSSSNQNDRDFKEEAEIAERFKQLPKLLASLESFSEK